MTTNARNKAKEWELWAVEQWGFFSQKWEGLVASVWSPITTMSNWFDTFSNDIAAYFSQDWMTITSDLRLRWNAMVTLVTSKLEGIVKTAEELYAYLTDPEALKNTIISSWEEVKKDISKK